MKKKVVSLLVAAAMGVSLFGCGNAEGSVKNTEKDQASPTADSEEKNETEKTTVKMAVWSSGAAENFQRGADAFNARQDNIEFVVEMQTGDYNQYLGAKVASDDLPDMFFLNPYSQIQQFAENDRIMALDDQSFSNKIFDSVKDACSYNGKIYAYPMCLEMLGVYYNQDLFEKAGITEIPKTFSQLEAICQKLQDNNITPFAATYKDAWTLNHMFSCIQGTAVGDYNQWITDMNQGEGSFKNENSDQEFNFMDLMKENSGSNYMDADSTSGFNAFAAGEAAMIVTGEFSLLNASSINPDLKVGLFGVPLTENEADAKLDVDVGICVVVNKNTPNPEAVMEVLDYMSDNQDREGWMHYTADVMGSAPPAMEFSMENSYPYFEDYLKYMNDDQTKPWVYLQLTSGANDIIGPAIQGYFAGTTDKENTLKELDSQFANLLE